MQEDALVRCTDCHAAESGDNGWNSWTLPSKPTFYVCSVCLESPSKLWKEKLSLYNNAGIGTGHFARPAVADTNALTESSGELFFRGLPLSSLDGNNRNAPGKTKLPFTYSKLGDGQIRLLTLLPGAGEDIDIVLHHVDFHPRLSGYTALSYCWGDANQPKKAIRAGDGAIEIRNNLYHALMQLRTVHRRRVLWVDAICINQQDRREKEVQIPLMGSIYKQASTVSIWLGLPTDSSDEVLDTIQCLEATQMASSRFLEGLSEIFSRPWFNRTWIVQEMALAKLHPEVLCGSRCVTMAQLLAVSFFSVEVTIYSVMGAWNVAVDPADWNLPEARLFPLLSAFSDNKAYKIHGLRQLILDDNGDTHPLLLHHTLAKLISFEATNPKDKVYGALGLIHPSVHDHLSVDYSKPVTEVYTDATTFIINNECDIDAILSLYFFLPSSICTDKPLLGIPSWVPDFAKKSCFLSCNSDWGRAWVRTYHASSIDKEDILPSSLWKPSKSLRCVPELKLQGNRIFTHAFIAGKIDDIVVSTIQRSMKEVEKSTMPYLRMLLRLYSPLPPEVQLMLRQLAPSNLDDAVLNPDLKWQIESDTGAGDLLLALSTASMFRLLNTPTVDMNHLDSAMSFWTQSLPMELYHAERALTLRQAFTACQKFLRKRNKDPDDVEIIRMWRELFLGYDDISEDDFIHEFRKFCNTGTFTGFWYSTHDNHQPSQSALDKKVGLGNMLTELFNESQRFFTTDADFYGISTTHTQIGDRLAFLFPPNFVAFLLRPYCDEYRILGPAIVPPELRKFYIQSRLASGEVPESIVIS